MALRHLRVKLKSSNIFSTSIGTLENQKVLISPSWNLSWRSYSKNKMLAGDHKNQVRFQQDTKPKLDPASIKSEQKIWAISSESVDASNPVDIAKDVFGKCIKSVIPTQLISTKVKVDGSILRLQNPENTLINLSHYKKKYVVGFGKACLPMAEALLMMFSGQIDHCIVSAPIGFRKCFVGNIEVHRGALNNIPDNDALDGSQAIVDLVKSCTPDDLLIVLITGGGSALLPYPIPPITLEEKKQLIRDLSKAGCSINELNTVRKRLSMVKGGGLVQMCKAGRILSLIISDVSGNPLDIIASGPTVRNLDPPNAALAVLEKYKSEITLPQSIGQVLRDSSRPADPSVFKRVTNFIIGDNRLALDAAAEAVAKFGLRPFIITSEMSGEAAEVGYDLATLSEVLANCIDTNIEKDDRSDPAYQETIATIFQKYKWCPMKVVPEILKEYNKASRGICLLFGGETTVKVRGSGEGGRNQELALAAGIRLDISRNLPHVKNKIAILSGGTDGFDGPNCAAGAVVECSTINDAQLAGLSAISYLKDNNSFNFFQDFAHGKYHLICGHTETNVMDVAIIVIMKKDDSLKSEKRKSML